MRKAVCSLQGVLAVLCLATSGCLHGNVRPAQARISSTSQPQAEEDMEAAAGFEKFFLHDKCTGEYPPQPDPCLHDQRHEESFKFGVVPCV
jgi:hypothetical protein